MPDFDFNDSWWAVLLAVGALLLCVMMGAGCADVRCLEDGSVRVACVATMCDVKLPQDGCVKRN